MKKYTLLLLAFMFSALFASAAPMPNTVVIGSGVQIKFLSADGTQPFTFQWKKNGVNIAGATSTALLFPSIQATDAGIYALEVRNAAGATISDAATLTVTQIAPGNILLKWEPISAPVAGAAKP